MWSTPVWYVRLLVGMMSQCKQMHEFESLSWYEWPNGLVRQGSTVCLLWIPFSTQLAVAIWLEGRGSISKVIYNLISTPDGTMMHMFWVKSASCMLIGKSFLCYRIRNILIRVRKRNWHESDYFCNELRLMFQWQPIDVWSYQWREYLTTITNWHWHNAIDINVGWR